MLDDEDFPLSPAAKAALLEPELKDVECWQCARKGVAMPAVSLTTLGANRPLCRACRGLYQEIIDQQLAEGVCTTCGGKGLAAMTGAGSGFCTAHEPAEVAERRRAGAAQEVVDALGDWHLTMAEELSVLLARVAEVGIAGEESFDSLSEALRVSLGKATEAATRKALWCAGWRLWCTGEKCPRDQIPSLGWTAASKMVRQDADPARHPDQQSAAGPGLAEDAYESLRRMPERCAET